MNGKQSRNKICFSAPSGAFFVGFIAEFNAAVSTATEKAFGIFGKETKGFNLTKEFKETFSGAIGKVLKNETAKTAVTAFLSNGTGEFAEEYIQQALSPIAENLAYNGEEFTFQNNPIRLISKENLYAGMMGFLTGTVFGGAESLGDTELMRMNEQFASVKKSGKAYGVDDGTIRKMQDASVRSDINVSFTDEASHYDAAEKRVYIDRNARNAAAEFSNVVRDNLNAIREGRNPDSAHNLYRLSKQTSDMVAGGKAYPREQLAKFTDKQLGAVLNVMRYRYMEGMSAKRQKLYLEMTSKLKTYEKRHTIASEQEGLGLRTKGDALSESNALQGIGRSLMMIINKMLSTRKT
ncbi:MAG: hypothetical protein ACC608_00555 [Anaerofustis sp.]